MTKSPFNSFFFKYLLRKLKIANTTKKKTIKKLEAIKILSKRQTGQFKTREQQHKTGNRET